MSANIWLQKQSNELLQTLKNKDHELQGNYDRLNAQLNLSHIPVFNLLTYVS